VIARRLLPYLAVLVALAAGWLLSQVYQARQESREKETRKIFRLQAADITAVSLKKAGAELELRKNGDWRLVRPVAAKADTATLNSLLTTLAGLDKQRALSVPESELAAFGLDKPAFVVEFTAGTAAHVLKVGSKTPGARTYYALADADPQVQIIQSFDKESLDRNLTSLRDKTIFTFDPAKVTALALKTPTVKMTLSRAAEKWSAAEDPKAQLREDKVAAFLRQLTMLRAREFAADQAADLKRYGLAPEAVTIAVTQGQDTQTLRVGRPVGERRYARKEGSPAVMVLGPEALTQVPASLSSWEDRRLWKGPETAVHRLTWGPPPTPTTAVKTPEGWKLTEPGGQTRDLPEMRLQMILFKLKELEYSQLPPTGTPPAGTPAFTVALTGEADAPLAALEAFPATAAGLVPVRVSRGEEKFTALVPDKIWGDWTKELDTLIADVKP